MGRGGILLMCTSADLRTIAKPDKTKKKTKRPAEHRPAAPAVDLRRSPVDFSELTLSPTTLLPPSLATTANAADADAGALGPPQPAIVHAGFYGTDVVADGDSDDSDPLQ